MTRGRVDIDPADPRGYYARLGVTPTATLAEIKSAFRRKAKDLHPDRNPDPAARDAFHRLTAAYEVLSDAERRSAYDTRRTTGTRPKQGNSGASAETARPQSRYTASSAASAGSRPRTSGQNTTQNTTQQAKPQAGGKQQTPRPDPRRYTAPPVACCSCGKIAAQPRFVEFLVVSGRLHRTVERWYDGVYCRACADRMALKTAFRNWVGGWWSLRGPWRTLQALGIALRGGRLSRTRNHALLLRQAQAFLAQGDPALAHAVALQSQQFATDGNSRLQTDSVLSRIRSAAPNKTLPPLRDKWRGASSLQLIQLLPIYLVIIVLAVLFWPGSSVLSTKDSSSLPDGGIAVTPAPEAAAPAVATPLPPAAPPPIVSLSGGGVRAGHYHDIRVAAAALRTGPGVEFKSLRLLGAEETVLVAEVGADGQWARVTTLDGRSGFINTRSLTPTELTRAEALRREQKRQNR